MPMRRNYPEDEARIAWLPKLLDSYALVDEGIAREIARREAEEKRSCACSRGCDVCCRTHSDIPAYPHELTGIYWYCMEKIKQPTREVLRQKLLGHKAGNPCPFLLGGTCVIYPLRPTGCRQFNVFGAPCAEDEDPFHTRREDVLTPDRSVTYRAFALVIGYYDIEEEELSDKEKHEAAEKVIHSQVLSLPGCEWRKLAERMGEIDGVR